MQLWGHPQKTIGIFSRSKVQYSQVKLGGGNYSAGLYSKSETWDLSEIRHFHHSMPSLLTMILGGKGPVVTTLMMDHTIRGQNDYLTIKTKPQDSYGLPFISDS